MPMVAARHSPNSREKEASRRRCWRLPQRTRRSGRARPRRDDRVWAKARADVADDVAASALLLSREAVAQTPAAKISCRNRTNTNWRSEPNQSSQAVEGSEEPAHDAGLEHTDARLCPSYNARRLCDSLTRKRQRVSVSERRSRDGRSWLGLGAAWVG
jgi:hypothetical protein